jgi:hypothetical protein
MSEQTKKIIEINGVKMEVDFRTADVTNIESFKVGDQVRVLRTDRGYNDSVKHTTHSGVIVGFDDFKNLPTILVAYIDVDYHTELKYASINAASADFEIIKTNSQLMPIDKQRVVDKMDREIESCEGKLREARLKKEYFTQYFNAYFGENN